jgi:hypothetical protein
MHKIYINFKNPEHIEYIEPLINLTIDNFILRYCTYKNNKPIPDKYLLNEPQINFYNYVWDCFIHVFKRDLFQEIHYLDVTSKDEIYNAILCIIDCEIFNNDITDSEDTNDR